jgi:hypothetical protein
MKRILIALALGAISTASFTNGRCMSREGYDARLDPSCYVDGKVPAKYDDLVKKRKEENERVQRARAEAASAVTNK